MGVIVEQEVHNCDVCPFGLSERVYTSDSWDNVRKINCSKLKREVHSYLDWNDKADVPNDCPFKVKEEIQEKPIKKAMPVHCKTSIHNFMKSRKSYDMADLIVIKISSGGYYVHKNREGDTSMIIDEVTFVKLLKDSIIPIVLSDKFIDLKYELKKLTGG
jgi:hypothetical protein